MANEIVKYHNSFNNLGLRGFTANQLNVLMAICSRMKEKEEEEIEFSFDYLKDLIKLDKNYTLEEFTKEIISVNKKLLNLDFLFEDENKIYQFTLFQEFEIDKNEHTLKISVNKKFNFILNVLTSNFTRFELEEFVNLKSSYTKEFYRRMKQYRSSGKWNVSLEDFKIQLNIPVNYRMCDIDVKVLKPILNELKNTYNLKVVKKYDTRKKGRPSVKGFEFTFLKEIIEIVDKKEVHINEDGLLEIYINRTLYVKDQKFNRYNYLKIKQVVNNNGKIRVYVKNQDDDYENTLYFDNLEIWNNYFYKHLV